MGFLGNMLALPGSGRARGASRKMSGIANQYSDAFGQYYQPSLRMLFQQATNPQASPWQQGQMRDFEANTMRDTQNASKQLQQNMVGRGMGQSGTMSSALSSLWDSYGKNMAGARQQQGLQMDEQRQRALQAMLGQAGQAGGQALGAYGQQYQNAMDLQQMWGNMLGQLGQAGGGMFGLR